MIKAKKTLGQHFLRSEKAVREIVEAGEVTSSDIILEIGPGEGVLTEALLKTGATVIVVEMDERCIPLLHEKFKKEEDSQKFRIIEGDIRDLELLSKLYSKEYLGKKEYKLIANIPYYITGLLFRMFLETKDPIRQPVKMVYLIQKEVAEQLVAKNNKYGNLYLAAKLYGDPKIISKVPRGCFVPPPKVDSAIIAINNISKKNIKGFDEKTFFEIIHAGLSNRRKMLLPNLVNNLNIEKSRLLNILNKLNIDEKVRAEDLEFSKWLELAKELEREQGNKGTREQKNIR